MTCVSGPSPQSEFLNGMLGFPLCVLGLLHYLINSLVTSLGSRDFFVFRMLILELAVFSSWKTELRHSKLAMNILDNTEVPEDRTQNRAVAVINSSM